MQSTREGSRPDPGRSLVTAAWISATRARSMPHGLSTPVRLSRSHRTHCSPGIATSSHAMTVLRSCSSIGSIAAGMLAGAPPTGWRGRGERKRPSSGWASLTPTEHDVVRLVSEGLANKDIATRLFVSPRTVQTHLTHVYRRIPVNVATGRVAY
jgi:DNA-binding CsgD family transcriptional regulator